MISGQQHDEGVLMSRTDVKWRPWWLPVLRNPLLKLNGYEKRRRGCSRIGDFGAMRAWSAAEDSTYSTEVRMYEQMPTNKPCKPLYPESLVVSGIPTPFLTPDMESPSVIRRGGKQGFLPNKGPHSHCWRHAPPVPGRTGPCKMNLRTE